MPEPRLFRYERGREQPLPRPHFARRLVAHFALAFGLVSASLAAGMAGYVALEHLSLTDAFLNAAMLLGGMGPVNPPVSQAGKLFAGAFALYCGLLFLIVAAILVGPVAHRILHHFHFDQRP